MTNYEGSCLCGAIRYQFEGEPLLTAVCHCRHCQKQSASAFSVVCAVPEAAFKQTGTTRIFNDKSDSGNIVKRHFCADCGSPIASITEALPGLVIVKAGTLDRFDEIVPTVEAYCDRSVGWVSPVADAERYRASNIGEQN